MQTWASFSTSLCLEHFICEMKVRLLLPIELSCDLNKKVLQIPMKHYFLQKTGSERYQKRKARAARGTRWVLVKKFECCSSATRIFTMPCNKLNPRSYITELGFAFFSLPFLQTYLSAAPPSHLTLEQMLMLWGGLLWGRGICHSVNPPLTLVKPGETAKGDLQTL